MRNWSRVAEIQHIGIRWPRCHHQWLSLVLIIRDVSQFSNLQSMTLIETGDIEPYHEPATQRFRLRRLSLDLQETRREVLDYWFWMVRRDILPLESSFAVEAYFAKLKRA
ncbi:hypothetical protein F5Y13DRAFT_150200 [Hypoxylon sp. FL1857]|nr:hypothetical protein F5Y13DRAFT_150200 [Hypoxylon sp. FL1857]